MNRCLREKAYSATIESQCIGKTLGCVTCYLVSTVGNIDTIGDEDLLVNILLAISPMLLQAT
jgi:hypothetical protein